MISGLVLALVVGVARGQDYCGFSPQHTMCRYSGVGPSCGPLIDMGVGDKERDMVLDYHNRSDEFQPLIPKTSIKHQQYDEDNMT